MSDNCRFSESTSLWKTLSWSPFRTWGLRLIRAGGEKGREDGQSRQGTLENQTLTTIIKFHAIVNPVIAHLGLRLMRLEVRNAANIAQRGRAPLPLRFYISLMMVHKIMKHVPHLGVKIDERRGEEGRKDGP
jgi:hypothetical protein